MPRIVDHGQKRRNIAEAVFRVIGRDGMNEVSMRDVAAEAGVSMGSIQHYFKTKDEMLLFALQHMHGRALARFTQRLGRLRDPSTRDYLRTVLRVLLPTDEESRQEATVNIAFFSASTNNNQFQDLLREGYSGLLGAVAAQLQTASTNGELNPEVSVTQAAATLFYTSQGLVGPVLLGMLSAQRAMSILDHELDRIFLTD